MCSGLQQYTIYQHIKSFLIIHTCNKASQSILYKSTFYTSNWQCLTVYNVCLFVENLGVSLKQGWTYKSIEMFVDKVRNRRELEHHTEVKLSCGQYVGIPLSHHLSKQNFYNFRSSQWMEWFLIYYVVLYRFYFIFGIIRYQLPVLFLPFLNCIFCECF